MARQNIEGPGNSQVTHSASDADPDFGDISEDLGQETRNTGVPSDMGFNSTTGARARLQSKAAPVVRASSEYIRSHDIEEMRSDLEREIRSHPLKSIAIALGTGYLIGRIFK